MSRLGRALGRSRSNEPRYFFLQGTFENSETLDADLSTVTLAGSSLRWVRKLEHVTGLASGDAVLMVKGPDLPLTIIGVLVGDINIMNTEIPP